MSQWQRTLNLINCWKLAKERKITPKQLATSIATRLEKLRPFNDEDINTEKEELIEAFTFFDENETWDELDYLLNDLYNWGDISLDGKFGGEKVCWIKTIG